MPRIRTIKPDFFTSLTIADLTYEARLTFIGLWTHVDDQGRCVDDARLVKAALWPLDERTAKDVDVDLWELSDAELIYRYSVGAKKYLVVSAWEEHQKISHPSKAKLPAPGEGEATPKAVRAPESSGNPPESSSGGFERSSGGHQEHHGMPEMTDFELSDPADALPYPGAVVLPMFACENVPSGNPPEASGVSPETSGNPPRGKERKGKDLYSASAPSSPDGEGPSENPPSFAGYDDTRFQMFWDRYPHKVSKKKACAAFDKALKRTTFDTLMAGLHRYLTEDRRALDGFVKDPTTWLNGDCWDDEPLRPAANGAPAPTRPKTRIRHEWMTRQ